MHKFLKGADLSVEIRNLVGSGPADIAVAFWGKGAADLLNLPKNAIGYRIACDAFSGACNPESIKELLDRGVEIFDVQGLHAKIYACSSVMVVGSANASANGLGEEATELRSLEAGIVTLNTDEILEARKWIDGLMDTTRQVNSGDIERIKSLWQKRRARRPVREAGGRLLDLLLGNQAFFLSRRWRFVLTNADEIPTNQQRKTYEGILFYRKTVNDVYPYYWDTKSRSVESGDMIIDLYLEDKKLRCDGVWEVEGVIADGDIVPCKPVKRPNGLRFEQPDCDRLAIEVAKPHVIRNFQVNTLYDAHDLAKALAAKSQAASASGNSPSKPASVAGHTPASVIRPVTSRAGVTSKA